MATLNGYTHTVFSDFEELFDLPFEERIEIVSNRSDIYHKGAMATRMWNKIVKEEHEFTNSLHVFDEYFCAIYGE